MSVVTSSKIEKFLSNLSFHSENPAQKAAYQSLQDLDFPTTKQEYWKYTRLGKIANQSFVTDCGSDAPLNITDYIISDNVVVMENGNFRADLSSFDLAEVSIRIDSKNEGVELESHSNSSIFDTINTAFTIKTIQVNVPAKVKWDKAVQFIFVETGEKVMSNYRLDIQAEAFSEAHFIATYVSDKGTDAFTNAITRIRLDNNAKITFDKVQISPNVTVATEYVSQAENSNFHINTITLNGLLVRNNLNIDVAGQNCETLLNGVVITKEKQHIDNHTFVNHLVSHCMSDEKYKYVLDEQSTGVFNGRVVVQPDAQKINAFQENGNILLSDVAKINSKPELEIYADDVKCSHGSTTGQLDENALFYLQARGIKKSSAQQLLVQAFVGEVLESIDNEKLVDLIQNELKSRFGWSAFL